VEEEVVVAAVVAVVQAPLPFPGLEIRPDLWVHEFRSMWNPKLALRGLLEVGLLVRRL